MKRVDLKGRTFWKLKVLGCKAGGYSVWWRCLCECGVETVVHRSNLLTGHTKSCGCLKPKACRDANLLPHGMASRNAVMNEYKRVWKKKRGAQFVCTLSDEQIYGLLLSDCFYCGSPPCRTRRGPGGDFTYNGIDRLNNDLGYSIDNVVACCTRCNFKKGSENFDEFVEWVLKTADHLKSKRRHWPKTPTAPSGVLPAFRGIGHRLSEQMTSEGELNRSRRKQQRRHEANGRNT